MRAFMHGLEVQLDDVGVSHQDDARSKTKIVWLYGPADRCACAAARLRRHHVDAHCMAYQQPPSTNAPSAWPGMMSPLPRCQCTLMHACGCGQTWRCTPDRHPQLTSPVTIDHERLQTQRLTSARTAARPSSCIDDAPTRPRAALRGQKGL
jgi:hypothetical protein